MYDVLIIEDNRELANLLKTLLEKKGFLVYHIENGNDVMNWFQEYSTDLVLLDLMLEDLDGFSICEGIRKKMNVPILVLSANALKESQLKCYDLGADDYFIKPFDFDVLVEKIKSVIKRYRTNGGLLKKIISHDIELNLVTHQVFLKKEEIFLNLKEFDLLKLFLENVGKTLTKDYLFQKIWGIDSFSEDQTLTVHIKMLRDKIEENPKNPKRIVTVWGVGYRYEKI